MLAVWQRVLNGCLPCSVVLSFRDNDPSTSRLQIHAYSQLLSDVTRVLDDNSKRKSVSVICIPSKVQPRACGQYDPIGVRVQGRSSKTKHNGSFAANLEFRKALE